MIWELIALILVLTLALVFAGFMYESKCRIEQWSARYFKLKSRYNALVSQYDKLRFRLEEKDAIIADAQAENEKWKMKAVEISINAQKESDKDEK